MSGIKTLDLRGLEHKKRESMLSPEIEGLAPGGSLRIVVEFNPLPLVFLLGARPGFEVVKEKDGPDEWVLLVKNAAAAEAPDKKARLKDILSSLKSGRDVEAAKQSAREFLKDVDAKTLGIVEQELLNEGFSHDEIRDSLCDLHLDAIRDSLMAKRIDVSAPHPIHTFMEEHKVIVESLHKLSGIVERLKTLDGYDEMGGDLDALKDISRHLVEAENHHQREEEALFPRIARHGISEPGEIMMLDHAEFRKRKRALYDLAQNHEKRGFEDFKREAIDNGEFIARELESHIFKEDNILYQIALQTLEPHEWDEVKRDCDKLGYCCFKPEDATSPCGCGDND